MGKNISNVLIVLCLSVIFILAIVLLGIRYGKYIIDRSSEPLECNESMVGEAAPEKETIIDIEKVSSHKTGVEAYYPRLLSGAPPTSLERWNKLIKQDFDKIIQIYSFQPIPGPTPPSTDVVPIMLSISYEVKGNTDSWLSLLYGADYSSIYSAHPSNLVYTTNIDKRLDRRLELGDIVNLNEAFVKEFRTWKLVDTSELSEEAREAIYDYINQITDEEFLEGFRAADRIGSGNPWGIYTYLTKDKLGISVEVPHYAGDHAEFEQAFTQLQKGGFLLQDTP